jgi:hypothetical protein
MNKQNLPTELDENRVEELLAKIHPKPSDRFFKQIGQASWKVDSEKQEKTNNLRPRWIISATMVVLMIGMLIVTPPGRAWAQEVFQFFIKVDSKTIPASSRELEQSNYFNNSKESYPLPLVPIFIPTVPTEIASLPDCDTPEKAQSYVCQIAYAESQLGFELMEFSEQPQDLQFQAIWFDQLTKSTMVVYEAPTRGIYLSLTQRLGNAPDQIGGKWSWVPASDVEKIKVGPFDGEYVSGSFELPAGSNEYVWRDSTSAQRVAWTDGTNWYLLDSSGLMNRDRLIELAASLVANPIMVEKQPDPEVLDITLSSISQAEAFSGLDLKAPTLLPIGLTFSEAHYTSFRKNEVSLRYESSNVGGNWMIIRVKKDNSINFDTLSPTQENYEVVKVNGQNALYGSKEGGLEPYLFLSWQDGELNYQLYFYWYNDFIHAVINKQKMIAIAKSMDDINVFKNRAPRPYEHVKIYEQALNMNIREFTTIPFGWSFNNFWVGVWEKCIGLSYTLSDKEGWLSLNQCGTDMLSKISDIPADAIEYVKVRENTAQYIIGNPGYDNNGNLVWFYDRPVQQLRWQENGLWIQFTVYGEDALIYDKEDLIAIAESLR